jgi:hypothetical protein
MNFGDRQNATAVSRDWERRFNLLVRRLFKLRRWVLLSLLVLGAFLYTWNRNAPHFVMAHADHDISGPSAYPLAVNPNLVGTYPSNSKSGSGYFYDDVLEYRVWLNPESGAKELNGGSDYYEAFAQYEKAKEFSKANSGAEEPLVLVRQVEWINEPEPGHFIWEKGERITEWQVQWLAGTKRTAESIKDFLKHPTSAGQ